jgi:hypothetical protein
VQTERGGKTGRTGLVQNGPDPSDLLSETALTQAWDYVLAGIDHDLRVAHRGLLRSYDVAREAWMRPCPATTGCTIRGLLQASRITGVDRYRSAALEMGNALLRLQQPGQAAAGAVPATDLLPRYHVFDTARTLEGLISLYHHTLDSRFLRGALLAGEFCRTLQEPDGSFLPVVIRDKSYTPRGHEGWELRRSYLQVQGTAGWYALSRCSDDPGFGAMAKACRQWIVREAEEHYGRGLVPPCRPRQGHSHLFSLFARRLPEHATYSDAGARVARGLLEDFLFTGESSGLQLALRMVRAAVLPFVERDGYLPYGISLRGNHRPVTKFGSLSGGAQYAWILMRLWQLVGGNEFLETAERLLEYTARVQRHASGPGEGGICGYASPDAVPHPRIDSPLDGGSTKFFGEALMLRNEILAQRRGRPDTRRTIQIVPPWTLSAFEEHASQSPAEQIPADYTFRSRFGSGPVNLSVRPAVQAISVRDDRGEETPAIPVRGFRGLFRADIRPERVYSVFVGQDGSDPLRPSERGP